MNKILAALFLLIFISACNKQSDKTEKQEISETKKGFSGKYSGVIPCGDCEGINFEITLNTDMTYREKMIYIGKDVAPLESSGKWAMEPDGKVILDGKKEGMSHFQFVSGNLLILDSEGKKYEGQVAERFVLKPGPMNMHPNLAIDSAKTSPGTTTSAGISSSWKLKEINSKKADEKNYMKGLPEIEIREADNKFSGSTGCNSISGASTIVDNGIVFTKFITTRMACPGTGETDFITALSSIDTYKIEKDNLLLLSKGKTILMFTRVK